MSERPDAVFGWIVASALALALAVGGALAALGIGGVAALAATIVGALTACVFFVAELDRVPLSALVLVALALGSSAGFARTLWSYWLARRLLVALPLERLDDAPLGRLAAYAGVQVHVTPARRPAAFCFGLLRRRVVVTSGLLERLSVDEQAAVIWHEAEHARNWEPLRCLLTRLAANTFFWVPMLRGLLDRFLLLKEIAADQRAVARTNTAALAGALYEVADGPSPAAVGAGDLAGARIERLFAPDASLPPLFRSWQIAGSGLGLGALALVLALPAQIDVSEERHLFGMLTSLSVHGLPGMAAGLALNIGMLAAFMLIWRRLSRRRGRTV
jgi:hypothetical protein